jgi:hypothetical protein
VACFTLHMHNIFAFTAAAAAAAGAMKNSFEAEKLA